MSDELFRGGERLTAAKLNRIVARIDSLAGDYATTDYVDNAVSSVVFPEIPTGLTEADVLTLINNAILTIQNPGSPPGVVINVDVGAGNATVSSGDFTTADTLQVINAAVANRTVTLPAVAGTVAIVSARTNTQSVIIQRGTTTYRLAVGGFVIVYLDGSANFMRILAASASFAGSFLSLTDTPNSYSATGGYAVRVNAGASGLVFVQRGGDLSLYAGSTMTNAEILWRLVTRTAFTILASSGNSPKASATVAATGSTTTALKKNGVQFGTIVWNAAATAGTVTISSATSFAADDVFTWEAPAVADATLANASVTLPYTWN